jgi:hypothetical protein
MRKMLLLAALTVTLTAVLVYAAPKPNGLECRPLGDGLSLGACSRAVAENDIANSCDGRQGRDGGCNGPSTYCRGADTVSFGCKVGTQGSPCEGDRKECGTKDKSTCKYDSLLEACIPDPAQNNSTAEECFVRTCSTP